MVQTNNSYLADKVALRAMNLPSGDISVLDCYGGSGVVWRAVEKITNRDIKVLPIDVVDYGDFFLPGNNMAYLSSINLDRYNVVDLDSYGVPYEQLKAIFDRGYTGTVFVTFIQSVVGAMNHGLLNEIGFTDEMLRKSPSSIYKRGWVHFCDYLALHGIDEILHRSKARKHYLTFRLDNGSVVSRTHTKPTQGGG